MRWLLVEAVWISCLEILRRRACSQKRCSVCRLDGDKQQWRADPSERVRLYFCDENYTADFTLCNN